MTVWLRMLRSVAEIKNSKLFDKSGNISKTLDFPSFPLAKILFHLLPRGPLCRNCVAAVPLSLRTVAEKTDRAFRDS